MAIGELRALPVGRGQIGKVKYMGMVKYIPLGVQVRGGRGIPSSVIKTGVKLPQMEDGKQKEKVSICLRKYFVFCHTFWPRQLACARHACVRHS